MDRPVYGPLKLGRGDASAGRALAHARSYARLRLAAAAGLGPASPASAVLETAVGPLAAWLGWPAVETVPHRIPQGLWAMLADRGSGPVALVTIAWQRNPDGALRAAIERVLAEGSRWVLISNGRVLRVADASRPPAASWLEFDLDLCRGDAGALGHLRAIVGPEAFRVDPAGRVPLEVAVEEADAAGVQVCRALRHGVRGALDALKLALARAAADSNAAGAEALTAVYRLLFLLFAEARGLVPSWHPIYRQGYTLAALVARIEAGHDPRGTWAALQAIARLAHAGCSAGQLRVPPFNGRLFSPSHAPLIDRIQLDDGAAASALAALTSTADGPAGRRRVSYADLGVEELGSVYEQLLETEEGGRALRKATGSFYTPRSITEYLVRATLSPLVSGRTSREVLALRVLDPAMGSGAFLVAACRFLADALERALVAEGAIAEHDVDGPLRAALRRQVAQRCLFGVDSNPMAVELAQLSLWLATLAGGLPLSFLDHHLACGDSLMGASPADLVDRRPGGRSRRGSTPAPLDAFFDACDAMGSILPMRARLEERPDDSVECVRDKERTLASLRAHPALSRWRSACSLWCGLWFPECAAYRPLYAALLDHTLGRPCALPAGAAGHAATQVLEAARTHGCFHWSLEFPEVFLDTNGRPRADAGFDAVVGNPPWEMLRAGQGAPAAAALVRFARDSGLYRAQSGGHANQYQLFVERALQLLRPGGRLGLLVPAGLLSDAGSAGLRRVLLTKHSFESAVVFSNRLGIFPIHRGLRFAAITAQHSGPCTLVRYRCGVEQPDAVERLDPSTGAAFPVALTRPLLERLAGPELAFPDLPTRRDAAIVERMAAQHPPLGSPNGWAVSFGRELNATDDRDCLTAQAHADDLIVVEGKHLQSFRVRLDLATTRASRARVVERLGRRAHVVDEPRLAYREVSAATNRTTLIAAILPPGVVSVHTVFCRRDRLSRASEWVLCALLNSYVANYWVRRWVMLHVTATVMSRVPVPRPTGGLFDELEAGCRALASGPRPDVEAHLQAACAEAYALDRSAFAHVLDSFPLIEPGVRQAALEAFTRRMREGSR